MKNRDKKIRFYLWYQKILREIQHRQEKPYDFSHLQLGNEVWGNVPPVGQEFGAAKIKKRRRSNQAIS